MVNDESKQIPFAGDPPKPTIAKVELTVNWPMRAVEILEVSPQGLTIVNPTRIYIPANGWLQIAAQLMGLAMTQLQQYDQAFLAASNQAKNNGQGKG